MSTEPFPCECTTTIGSGAGPTEHDECGNCQALEQLGITREEWTRLQGVDAELEAHEEALTEAFTDFCGDCSESETDMPPNWVEYAQAMLGEDEACEIFNKHYRGDDVEAERRAVDDVAELRAKLTEAEGDREKMADAIAACTDNWADQLDDMRARADKLEAEAMELFEIGASLNGTVSKVPGWLTELRTERDEQRTRADKAEERRDFWHKQFDAAYGEVEKLRAELFNEQEGHRSAAAFARAELSKAEAALKTLWERVNSGEFGC